MCKSYGGHNLQFDKVIGHRGACGYAPENTKISMLKAYQLGVKWVEFDVMLTADKIPVVIHDDNLDRTTNGKGAVANQSYQDLAQLDAGSWFSPEYAGEIIPRFYDLIHYLDKLDLAFNVEIKAFEGEEDLTAKLVIQELATLPKHRLSQVIVSSFSADALYAVRKYNSDIALGYLIDDWQAPWLTVVNDLNCISLNVDEAILTPEKVASVKNQNKKILSYTVNSKERAEQLFQWGVTAVFSDFPDKILHS